MRCGFLPVVRTNRSAHNAPSTTSREWRRVNLELNIRPEWQFGAGTDPSVTRMGAYQQSVALAIQRHLFAPVGADDSAGEAAGNGAAVAEVVSAHPAPSSDSATVTDSAPQSPQRPTLADKASAFAEALAAAQWPQPQERALLEPFGHKDDPHRGTALFCLTLHALCWSLAAARLEDGFDDTAPADLDAEGAEDGGDAAVPANLAPVLAVERSVARMAVARALLAAQPRKRRTPAAAAVSQEMGSARQDTSPTAAAAAPGPLALPAADDHDDGPTANHARLVAEVLLSLLLDAMPDVFAQTQPQTVQEDGQPRTRSFIVIESPDLADRVTRMLAALPLRFTVQPLAQPVAYAAGGAVDASQQPTDGPSDAGGSVEVPLVGYRRMNGFLRRFQSQVLRRAPLAPFVQAVDRQQAVAWRINKPLWQWALRLREMARPRDQWLPDLEQRVEAAGLDDAAVQDWQRWLAREMYRPAEQRRRRKAQEAPADFLDNALARNALWDLMSGGEDGQQPRPFFLPWKADYRGRIYAETPWLTPQGGDLQRALFEFAHGQVLDEAGVRALRRHGANLAKRSVVLKDLGIGGRQVLTLEERERWVLQHEEDIVRSAQDPLGHPFWRIAAGKPMQFLAFCLAYAQWKQQPDTPIHLPVQIDGTCNGLQHIAALAGDEALARAVNVLPRDDGAPGDIYSELADAARSAVAGAVGEAVAAELEAAASVADETADAGVEQNATEGAAAAAGDNAMAAKALRFAQDLLAAREDLRALLDRSAAKAVVMTVPYGASPQSQAEAMVALLAGPKGGLRATGGEPSPVEKLLAAQPLSAEQVRRLAALTAAVRQDTGAKRFVRDCTHGRFAALRDLADRGDAVALQQLEQLRVLATYLGLALVRAVRSALDERFPGVHAFSRWLAQVARRCEGAPLMWWTPLGLPVCQDSFRERRNTLNVRMPGRRPISIGTTELLEQVSETGQSRQLLPNLVHSLDATHLAMTINMAAAQGIGDFGSIHDCLLCRPNEAEHLAVVLRRAFAKLYEPDPTGRPRVLTEWEAWMALLAQLTSARGLHAVSGSLTSPGGMGEKLLLQRADRKVAPDTPATIAEDIQAAQAALGLIDAVRQLPADTTAQRMALLLIDYLKGVPMKPTARETAEPGQRAYQPLKNPLKPPPVSQGLPLGREVPTAYFFC